MLDYDDPRIEEQWCLKRRDEVAAYLKSQHIVPGRIGVARLAYSSVRIHMGN